MEYLRIPLWCYRQASLVRVVLRQLLHGLRPIPWSWGLWLLHKGHLLLLMHWLAWAHTIVNSLTTPSRLLPLLLLLLHELERLQLL